MSPLWFLIYLISFVSTLYGTFVFLLAVLKLRDAKESGALKEAPWVVKGFAYTTLGIGYLFDICLNILLSPLFLEPPYELLTTDRVKRLKRTGNTWQRSCANWLCKQLNSLDENHCG